MHCLSPAKTAVETKAVERQVVVISRPDVNRLVVKSELPAAKEFERVIFEEILPSIQDTGSYHAPGVAKALPTDYISALESLLQFEKEKAQLALETSGALALKDHELEEKDAVIREKDDEIAAGADDVEFGKRMEAEDQWLLLGEAFAKIPNLLHRNGREYRMRERRGRELLVAEHYIKVSKRGSRGRNEYTPVASQIENGRFRSREREYDRDDGTKGVGYTLEVSAKGMTFLSDWVEKFMVHPDMSDFEEVRVGKATEGK
jgi:prophage antirepressor-like protein